MTYYITINGEPWCDAEYRMISGKGLPDVNDYMHEHGLHPYIVCATNTPERDLKILREFYKDYPHLVFGAVDKHCPASARIEDDDAERREAENEHYDLPTVRKQRDDLRELLEDLVQQYAYEMDNPPRLTTGGLSVLESAFEILGWDDPHPVPERKCDEEGCTKTRKCGWPDKDGKYRHTCHEHTPPFSH